MLSKSNLNANRERFRSNLIARVAGEQFKIFAPKSYINFSIQNRSFVFICFLRVGRPKNNPNVGNSNLKFWDERAKVVVRIQTSEEICTRLHRDSNLLMKHTSLVKSHKSHKTDIQSLHKTLELYEQRGRKAIWSRASAVGVSRNGIKTFSSQQSMIHRCNSFHRVVPS